MQQWDPAGDGCGEGVWSRMHTCESPGAVLIVLEAKFLPCKEGEGSELGPKLCLFAQQRHASSAESGQSCAGVLWAHGALQPCPLLGAHHAHMLAAPLLSYGTINGNSG